MKNIGREGRLGITPRHRIPQGKPQLHWLILLIWMIFNHPHNGHPDPLPLLLDDSASAPVCCTVLDKTKLVIGLSCPFI